MQPSPLLTFGPGITSADTQSADRRTHWKQNKDHLLMIEAKSDNVSSTPKRSSSKKCLQSVQRVMSSFSRRHTPDSTAQLTQVRSEEKKTTKGHVVSRVALFPRSQGILSRCVNRSEVRGTQPAVNHDNFRHRRPGKTYFFALGRFPFSDVLPARLQGRLAQHVLAQLLSFPVLLLRSLALRARVALSTRTPSSPRLLSYRRRPAKLS